MTLYTKKVQALQQEALATMLEEAKQQIRAAKDQGIAAKAYDIRTKKVVNWFFEMDIMYIESYLGPADVERFLAQ